VISTVILVGFMGAGKTTAGRLLAERLGWDFVDLDDRIREHEGRSVPEIFGDRGEAHFRRVESECLEEVLRQNKTEVPSTALGMTGHRGLVLALGGGAFVQARNQELIRMEGVPVVFLDALSDVLYRRCIPQAGDRPLLADENQFRQLYESRREGYMTAEVRVDTTALTPGQVADEIASRLDLADYS
jgi:shikimate kinase